MRRPLVLGPPVIGLVLLAALALLLTTGCSKPGGSTTTATPTEIVGKKPVNTGGSEEVPPEYQNGDATAGKPLFKSQPCASCHTLSDAGSTGTVGPNLDTAKPELALVVDRVVNGRGAMPPFKAILSAKQIADVAAYVVDATS